MVLKYCNHRGVEIPSFFFSARNTYPIMKKQLAQLVEHQIIICLSRVRAPYSFFKISSFNKDSYFFVGEYTQKTHTILWKEVNYFMKNKGKLIKVLGFAATLIGLGVTLMTNWVEDQKMDEKITEKLNDEFEKRKLN